MYVYTKCVILVLFSYERYQADHLEVSLGHIKIDDTYDVYYSAFNFLLITSRININIKKQLKK